MKQQNNQIAEIQQEIDNIKEYVQSEICKKCEEMNDLISKYQKLLQEVENNASAD